MPCKALQTDEKHSTPHGTKSNFTSMQDIIRKFSTNLSTNLAEFIVQAYDYTEFGAPPHPLLPTAAVVGGSSSSRSVILEEAFELHRRNDRGLYISELHARDCGNLTSAMRCLILGFVGQVAADDDEDEAVASGRSGGPAMANYDISLLEAWYRQFSKRRDPPKLVAVISDFEAFDGTVLEDLLYICSRHATTLPLVFIFGISTSSSCIHQSLSRKTVSCLELSSFAAAGGQELFQSVMEAVFLSSEFDPGVIFNPEALETLSRAYETSGSFDFVQSVVQLLLLRHFSEPLSILITASPVPSSLTPGFRTHLRSKLVSGTEQFLALDLPTEDKTAVIQDVLAAKDDAGLMRAVDSLRGTFARRMGVIRRVVLPLLKLVHDLVGGTRGGRKAGLMDVWKNKRDAERWLEAVGGKIRRKSAEEILDLLDGLLEYVCSREEEGEEGLGTFRAELEVVAQEVQSEVNRDELEERTSPSKAQQLLMGRNILSGNRKNESAEELIKVLAAFVRGRLYPLTSLPLSEVWYVNADGADSIKELLEPSIRSTIISALLTPHAYLQCACCKPTTAAANVESQGPASMVSFPDISIAFSRYLNSGKSVNVYDWYETFSVGLEGEGDLVGSQLNGKGSKSRKKNKEDEEEEEQKKVQARFLRCFHEFDHLGLLKHSGRKISRAMQVARSIGGTHTEVLIQSYGDRILVLVTQLGKVGCLIQASIPAATPLPPPLAPPALAPIPPGITLVPLFGQPPSGMQTVYNLYASQIAAILWAYEGGDGSTRRPVVVGLALKKTGSGSESVVVDGPGDEETGGAGEASDEERELFRGVMEMIKEVLG
ncbi:hypothetical protein FRB90_002842 [Tulasnella sp. 427]|nr:hypothetical protein FRB90_002842 [Tulasnella sp. 427]